METIGQRLRRLRDRKKLTVNEVAHSLGIAPSTYREWEYGREIRGEPYSKLCEVLGVSLETLILGKNAGSTQKLLDAVDRIEKDLLELRAQILSSTETDELSPVSNPASRTKTSLNREN